MSVSLSTALRNGMLNATGFTTALSTGAIYIYSGPQPLNADAAVQGTLLGVVSKDAGAYTQGTSTNGLVLAVPASGVVAKNTDVWQMVAVATGIAGWFRFKGTQADADGSSTTNYRLDGSVGTAGADLNLSSVNIASGAPTTIDVWQFTLPSS